MRVIAIRHDPEYKERAVEYIYEKWGDGTNRQLYEDSIFGCIESEDPVPHWYLLEDDDRIVGCAGLVEHDFIDRVDLSPWLCALYIEKDERGKSLSILLIDQVKRDAAQEGFEKVYLCTDHIGFYEKFGFQYIGEGEYPDGEPSRIYTAELAKKDRIVEFKHITDECMIGEVKRLFSEYAQSLEVDLDFQNFEMEFQTLPGKYGPPDGVLILASVDGNGAGCVALRKLSDHTCEMKRLYIQDEYRGLGIGKKLIMMIMEEARKLQYSYIRLDTLPTMKKAQELYMALGFYDIEPYVYNPIEGTRFMEFDLVKKGIDGNESQ